MTHNMTQGRRLSGEAVVFKLAGRESLHQGPFQGMSR